MSGGGFAKVFESILLSSIWTEPDHVLRLWITFLVRCNRHGYVEGSIPGLARLANISIEKCEDAIARLEAPDPYSKTPDNEGRRIRRHERGWLVLNHAVYRDLLGVQDDELSQTPEAVRKRRQRERERQRDNGVTGVTSRDSDTPPSASASASESEEKGEVQEGEPKLMHMEGDVDAATLYCVRLTVAANKGLNQPIPRILWSSGSTRQVVDILIGADIPLEFAEAVVFERASACKNPGEVRALSYFTKAVTEAWERKAIADASDASPLGKKGVAGGPKLATCPICKQAGIAHGFWTPHFLKEHPRDDVPSFTDNIITRAD